MLHVSPASRLRASAACAARAAFALAAFALVTGCGDDDPPMRAPACSVAADCDSDALCIDGACVTRTTPDAGRVCAAPRETCGVACVDTSADRLHCGACGATCTAAETCVAGVCDPICDGGQTSCFTGCADLSSDELNCGTCGTTCPARWSCVASACVYECTPSAPPSEVCDGVDNDCNGAIDEPECAGGLAGWWRLDERAGALLDVSGNANIATATPRVIYGVPGKRGLALGLDGFGETGADIADSASLTFGSAFTAEVWVRVDNCTRSVPGFNDFNVAVGKEGEFLLGFDTSCNLVSYIRTEAGIGDTVTGGWLPDATGVPITPRTWQHLAMSYDGTTIRSYLNGAPVGATATHTYPGPMVDSANRVTLGRRPDCCVQTVSGFLDEVKLWTVVRTTQQICEDAGGLYEGSPAACRVL